MGDKYVVIAESKLEGPLVYETYISHASYDHAHARMLQLAENRNVIRVCMAKLVFENGHGGFDIADKE